METADLDSFYSSEGKYRRKKLAHKKPIELNQYRRREKMRGRFGIMLLVYACMLVVLGYLLIEIMKMVK